MGWTNLLTSIFCVFIWIGFYELINDSINELSPTRTHKIALRLTLILIGCILFVAAENDGDCWPRWWKDED